MNETVTEILRALVGAFFGSVGFAMLVHVPKRSWLPSGMIAGLSYLLYWALTRPAGLPDPVGIFAGSLFGCLMGHVCAWRMKMINTVFLTAAVVPVVPGLGLYRMMAQLGQGNTAGGASMGVGTMVTIAMIVLGLTLGSFIFRQMRHAKEHARGGGKE